MCYKTPVVVYLLLFTQLGHPYVWDNDLCRTMYIALKTVIESEAINILLFLFQPKWAGL